MVGKYGVKLANMHWANVGSHGWLLRWADEQDDVGPTDAFQRWANGARYVEPTLAQHWIAIWDSISHIWDQCVKYQKIS